ncbi:helix-turn-helix domain-containing protein [Streptomyces sp. NPDC058239]|uniref:helix-turn-helix domain-containing protein n=1 Tax=unclassified Streptomyces TaxID=2593676 RepID=UPI003659EC29
MSTDDQQARTALGARLRELRTEAGLTVRGLAAECGWVPSKISKPENGKQTATTSDLDTWAAGVGRPETAAELKGRRSQLMIAPTSCGRGNARTRGRRRRGAADDPGR